MNDIDSIFSNTKKGYTKFNNPPKRTFEKNKHKGKGKRNGHK